MRSKNWTLKLKFCMSFLFMVLVLACHAETSHNKADNKEDLQASRNPLLKISAKILNNRLRATDDIVLVVTMRNDSSVDYYVPGRDGFSNGIFVQLTDHDNGRAMNSDFVETLLPPLPKSVHDFAKISPGTQLEERVRVPLIDYQLQVGHQYDLIVEYRSSVPKRMGFGLNIHSSEMGALISTPVLIAIVDN